MIAVGGPFLVMVKSGIGAPPTMVVTCGALLFAAFVSPPPLTRAVLSMIAASVGTTWIVATVIFDVFAAKGTEDMHVTVLAGDVQLKPAPAVTLTRVKPPGRVSLTVMRPAVGPVPTLASVMT